MSICQGFCLVRVPPLQVVPFTRLHVRIFHKPESLSFLHHNEDEPVYGVLSCMKITRSPLRSRLWSRKYRNNNYFTLMGGWLISKGRTLEQQVRNKFALFVIISCTINLNSLFVIFSSFCIHSLSSFLAHYAVNFCSQFSFMNH